MDSRSLDYFRRCEPQIFNFWSTLTIDQQQILLIQLQEIDLNILERQKQLIQKPQMSSQIAFEPFDDFAYSGNLEDRLHGQSLIEQGRLGCLLLAGGQGTRLKAQGPKGMYPISMIKHKSLFQICAERVGAASKRAGRPLQLAIMTSPDNDQEIRHFFQKNGYFGLEVSQVQIFVQEILPLLDVHGHVFLETPWQLWMGPNGNGHSLLHFVQSGIYEEWSRRGIDFIHVIVVDNPLADPFDAELVGFHQRQQVEITVKSTEKYQPEEKMGVLVKQERHCRVIEYSEMPNAEKLARRDDGRLKHCCANMSLFCFSMSFIRRIADKQRVLPLHKAWKSARYVDEGGFSHVSSYPMAWKFETFIFDWLIDSNEVAVLLYPREQCFAPLKNAMGFESPETVQAALQQADRRIIQNLTGLPPPDFSFELAAEFYYPTQVLRDKWRGRSITTSYVEP